MNYKTRLYVEANGIRLTVWLLLMIAITVLSVLTGSVLVSVVGGIVVLIGIWQFYKVIKEAYRIERETMENE